MSAAQPLARSRRLVVKVGSALLCDETTGLIRRQWLDALCDGGRLLVPLTGAMSGPDGLGGRKLPPDGTKGNTLAAMKTAMMANIGKGFMLLLTRAGTDWKVRPLPTMPVAIYSLKNVRDEALGAALGQAMMSGRLVTVTRLRRDRHDPGETCVVHGATTCLTSD